MARPTTKPRLADLVPARVAEQAEELAIAQIGRLAFALQPSVQISVSPKRGATNLGQQLIALCLYAQTGEIGPFDSPRAAETAVRSIATSLYGPAAWPGDHESGPLEVIEDEAVSETPLGLVLLGAYAQARLGQDGPVTARELAILAGVSPDHVLVVLRTKGSQLGQVWPEQIGPTRITAESATAWLQGRKIKAAEGPPSASPASPPASPAPVLSPFSPPIAAEQIDSLLKQIYAQSGGPSDRAIQIVTVWIKAYLYEEIDQLFMCMDTKRVHVSTTVVLLSLTEPCQARLTQRGYFLARAEAASRQTGGKKTTDKQFQAFRRFGGAR